MPEEPTQPKPQGEHKTQQVFSAIWEFLKIIIVALVIVLPIRYYIFQPFIVKGDSMVPNFHSGDYLIVDEISYRLLTPHRGDVVVLKYPLDTTQRFIKRVIGLPGETVDIKNGLVTITKDGQSMVLKEEYLPHTQATDCNESVSSYCHVVLTQDQYFVMGDNRQFSYDSRSWGPLPKQDLIGKAEFRVYPFAALAYFSSQPY